MEKCGIQNHILCRPGGTILELLKNVNIPVTTYKPLVSWVPQFCLTIPMILKKIAPDIIHTRLSSAAMIAGYWGSKMQIPVVSTMDIYAKKKYYMNSTKLIACSSAILHHLENLEFNTSDLELIHNAVNVEEYRKKNLERQKIRETLQINESDFVILGAGRLVHIKGFDTLIKACSLLNEKSGIGKKWKLWLVGDGTEMANLKKLVADLELDNKTTFWGFQIDVKPFLWASDLFVLPSHNEPFGLVLLEAMASGLPPVATSVGGALDLMKNNFSDWLFEPNDAEMLFKKILSCMNIKKPDEFSRIAQRTAANFSVEKIGNQTIKFYKKTIKTI